MADHDSAEAQRPRGADRRWGEHRLNLADTLRARIAAEGPIPLADYMAACNAHYYATRDPFGPAGDFVTAPEMSQMFGELIGVWLADVWDCAGRPDAAYVELGPGRGTLAADALRAMRTAGLTPPVHLIETSPVLRLAQADRIPAATWHDDITTPPDDRALLVVANEFFDALPVRQLVRAADGWRERMVGWDGGFVPVTGNLTSHSAEGEAGVVQESRPAADAIVAALAARIARHGGVLLVIDYGHRRTAFGDTLQAVRGHARADPFGLPGEVDLTAHVDFEALAAVAAPLRASRIVDQGEWLYALGLAQRAAALTRAAPDRADEIAAAYHRLSAPEAMGALFKVVAFTAPGWLAPAGL